MARISRVLRLLDGLIELGWLAAIVAIPLYFNVDDVRAFEPDKAILLRDLAAPLITLAALRLTLHALAFPHRRIGRRPHLTTTQPPSPSRPRSRMASTHGTSADDHGDPPGFSRNVPCHPVSTGGPPSPRPTDLRPRPLSAQSFGSASLRRCPILLSMLALAATTLLATAASILPAVSWHGSYARRQGALTTLAYLALALLVLAFLRRPRQAERLATAIALSGLAPAAYGWVQHFGRDPLPWQQPDLAARVPGTLGNPIFLGALLAMTLPLALYRLATALQPLTGACIPATAARTADDAAANATTQRIPRQDRYGAAGSAHEPPARAEAPSPSPDRGRGGACHPTAVGGVALWSLVVLVEGAALLFTKSRGPFAGALVAAAAFGLGLAAAWRLPWLRRLTLGAAALAVAALLGANLLAGRALGPIRETSSLRLVQWSPAASGTSEVRLDIWGPALQLVARRPLLGCGPDALQFCYYPVYPTALRHIEAPNAVPDRTHNMFLDTAVETGLLGLAALLALLAAAAGGLAAMEAAGAPARHDAAHHVEPRPAPTATGGGRHGGCHDASATGHPTDRGRRSSAPGAHSTGFDPPSHIRPRSQAPTIPALLCLPCLLCLCVSTARIWQDGARATGADVAARQGAGLEQVALGNSGQAPVPAGVTPQPVLALRQFAAAVADQEAAIRQAPDPAAREAYLLDAGIMLVEWAQAAAQVGGPAAAQAPDLYVQALGDFGRAARLNPYNPDHLRNTGKAYERWAGLGHDPTQPATWDRDLLARAADAFARAAALAPHHPDPLTSWAQVALWRGNTRQATSLLARALALDPRDGDADRLRASVELAQGRRLAALADWRRALADPDASHAGETASQLALAEATWAHARCPAVRDARTALGEPDTPDPTTMREILRVDGPRCPGW